MVEAKGLWRITLKGSSHQAIIPLANWKHMIEICYFQIQNEAKMPGAKLVSFWPHKFVRLRGHLPKAYPGKCLKVKFNTISYL